MPRLLALASRAAAALTLTLTLTLTALTTPTLAADPTYPVCVVGAGPAGLQLSAFLADAGTRHVVFERAPLAGSFFSTYPRHR